MSLSVQLLSLLAMVGTGVVSAAFIDMIGTGTAYAGKGSFVRRRATLFEVIGWIIAGCWTFYILYIVRDGAWRVYDPFAQLSGIMLYVSYFHRPFRFFGRIILTLLVKPIWFIVRTVVMVIGKIIQLIMSLLSFLFKPFVLIFRKQYRNLFENREK